jgi:hypothetical protein
MWRNAKAYNAETFTNTDSYSAAAALTDARTVTRSLLKRLFAATSGSAEYDPFARDR